MPTYEFPGEPCANRYPAAIDMATVYGVEVLRIVGTESDIRETTRLFDERHPDGERTTLGDDAQFLYYARDGKNAVEIYELIVIRKVT